jgi:hypothetical protein
MSRVRTPWWLVGCLGCFQALAAASELGPPALIQVKGEVIHATQVDIAGFTIRDVKAVPYLNGRKLFLDQAEARVYGGLLSGWVRSDLENGGWSLRLALKDGDLASFLRQYRGNAQNLGGLVQAWAELSAEPGGAERIRGQGVLVVEQASLIHLNLFANLLVGDPTGARNKDRLEVHFRLADGIVTLEKATIVSPSANIRISGTIRLDGTLNLVVVPELRLKVVETATVGTVNRLLSPLSRGAGRFLVRGRITNPVVVSDPFGLGDF